MRIPHPTRYISSIRQIYLEQLNHNFQNLSLLTLLPKISHFYTHPAPSSSSSSAMAGESESFSTVAEATAKYGFERSEMYQSSLTGTVDPYERHVFLCYKSHEDWPARVENSDSDPLPKLLASSMKARKNDISLKTRLTICEGDDLKFSDGDVLIFPEMIVIRGLTESDVDSFVEDVLVNGRPWISGVQEELTDSFVFVCAHNNRDRRCGVCGPILIEKFKEEIGSKDLKGQVFVAACSHVGGHKYAGNVITFCSDPDGKIAGNWYGYVTPNDVVELLDKQIGKGEVIDRIWRGQMGAKAKEVEVEEPNHATEANANVNGKLPETVTEDNMESVGSCCQGVNGFSCCRAENVEKKQTKNEFSSWVGKFEQRHLLTTVAVVGAIATVAVAYGFYRRAR
ncbi:Sucrase/ferredoxin-like family protein [Striga hermonthica]|uniref:Sucrase/ferredoxin-like family protein n=1 Tax=Striga hermonthica TaxID=68872 RepID=A0A9N7N383_STRHE|nr:Sucrase/ferredoxin-like family protein [Striga hermonthica]